MPITSLKFTNVGPFDEIEFEFDKHVNVFTGPNNSGKSTALMVLADILVFPFSTPNKLLREGAKFEGRFVNTDTNAFGGELPVLGGRGGYWDEDERLGVVLDLLKAIGYSGFIPALRRSTDFRSRGPTAREQGTDEEDASTALEPRAQRARREPQDLMKRRAMFPTSHSSVHDEAVIQKIVDLDYAAYRREQPSMREIVERVGSIASEITDGFPIKFLRVSEDGEGLFPQFRTPDGDVPLNVLSQGTQSIIQWLTHLLIGFAEYYDYAADLEEKPGVLIIDEIDAHLHPSWQRRIIPALTSHFPNLQIFCSTHSPLMLAGLKAGQVQLLRRDENGKVTVSRNEADIVGWSADEILRSFLDVPSPTDLETMRHIERLQELRSVESPSAEEAAELEQLRHAVSQDLIGGPLADQLEELRSILNTATADLDAQPPAKPPGEPAKRRKKASSASTSRRTPR